MARISQTKPRFDRIPKRDRDEVLRLDGILSSWAPSPEAYASNGLRLLCAHQEQVRGRVSNSQLLATSLYHLMSYFRDRGIIRRFLDNDVAQLRLGVDTAARLALLVWVAGGADYLKGCDCAYIFDLLLALAVEDKPLVDAYLNHFHEPSHSGHPAPFLMCNGLYAVLRGDRKHFGDLEQSIRDKSDSNFFRAMYDCLLGIMADDSASVAAAIGQMVKWNRRQEVLNSSMQKRICLIAHAYYNVCRRVFIPRGVAPPVIPDESTWDGEFQELIQTNEEGAGFFDFSPVNPVLARWMKELPAEVDLEELLAQVS